MRLAGKVAVITGGSFGIGRATAILFAREGARVVVGNRNVEAGEATLALVRDAGGEGHFQRTDATVAADVERLIESAVAAYGKLDCLFNNAGINLAGAVTEVSEADWQRCIDTNLKSVFLGSRYALPHLIRNGGGTIINNSLQRRPDRAPQRSRVLRQQARHHRPDQEHGPPPRAPERARERHLPRADRVQHDGRRPGGPWGTRPRLTDWRRARRP